MSHSSGFLVALGRCLVHFGGSEGKKEAVVI